MSLHFCDMQLSTTKQIMIKSHKCEWVNHSCLYVSTLPSSNGYGHFIPGAYQGLRHEDRCNPSRVNNGKCLNKPNFPGVYKGLKSWGPLQWKQNQQWENSTSNWHHSRRLPGSTSWRPLQSKQSQQRKMSKQGLRHEDLCVSSSQQQVFV